MSIETQGYRWSDAWLLTAIYGASLGGEVASLERVIGTGDLINHAIFTLAELNGGFDRLERGGLISVRGQASELTELGKETTAGDPKAKKGILSHVETVRMRLGAYECGSTQGAGKAGNSQRPTIYVGEEMLQVAVKEYRKLIRKRPEPTEER